MQYEQKYKKTFSILRNTKLIVFLLLLVSLGPYAVKKTWTSLKDGWQEGVTETNLKDALGVVKVGLATTASNAMVNAEKTMRNTKSEEIVKKNLKLYLEILNEAAEKLNEFNQAAVKRGDDPIIYDEQRLTLAYHIMSGLHYLHSAKLLEDLKYEQSWSRLISLGNALKTRDIKDWKNFVANDNSGVRSKLNATGNAKEDFKIPPLPSLNELKVEKLHIDNITYK